MSLYIFGVGLTFLLYLLYSHLTRNFKYWKSLNVPYNKPKLLFGNVFRVCTFEKSIGEFIDDLYKNTKSKLFGFYVFDQPFLLIRDPDLIKHVLVKDFEHFSDRSVISNGDDDKFASSMLFNLKNPSWRNVRMKVTPTFTSGKIKKMTELIINSSKGLIEYVEETKSHKNEFDARDLVMKFTTDVISTCAFGITANSFKENAEFREASKRVFELNLSRAIQAVSSFFAPMIFKIFKMRFIEPSAIAFMHKAFIETLRERENDKTFRGDLVDILIQIKNSEENSSEKIGKSWCNLLNISIIDAIIFLQMITYWYLKQFNFLLLVLKLQDQQFFILYMSYLKTNKYKKNFVKSSKWH